MVAGPVQPKIPTQCIDGRAVLADDRHELMEATDFAEVTVEPTLRFGHVTTGVKP